MLTKFGSNICDIKVIGVASQDLVDNALVRNYNVIIPFLLYGYFRILPMYHTDVKIF